MYSPKKSLNIEKINYKAQTEVEEMPSKFIIRILKIVRETGFSPKWFRSGWKLQTPICWVGAKFFYNFLANLIFWGWLIV